MSTYTANQTLFFPHIYMLNRYANVQHYVSMNNAQFTKFGHQSRVELLDKHGNVQLLIVPLKNRSYALLNEVRLDNPAKTKKTILTTIQTLYGSREPYIGLRKSFTDAVSTAPSHDGVTLAEFNNHLLRWLFDLVKIKVKWHDSEVIVPQRPDHPSEWVAEMGRAINCTKYLGGAVAQAAYLREEDFAARGMTFVAQNYVMPPYKRGKDQLQPRATISSLDPLFVGGVGLVQDLIQLPAY